MARRRYSREEIEWLELNAERLFTDELVSEFQKRWPERSKCSILRRVSRSGLTAIADRLSREWVGRQVVWETLGCSDMRIRRLMEEPGVNEILMPRVHPSRGYIRIKRSRWRALAVKRPELFGGLCAENLFCLIEDRDLAESIARNYPDPPLYAGRDFRIRCVETGEEWASARHAAADLNITRPPIIQAIIHKRPVPSLGLTFIRLREAS